MNYEDVEKSAESTLFIMQGMVNGKPQLSFRVNYLALLHLHTDVENTVTILNNIVATEQNDVLERDTLLLLQVRNWRFHLVACGVLLAGHNSNKLLNQLWNVLQKGSWVAPQLAATAYLLDPAFHTRALVSIAHDNFNEQSIVALAQLLSLNSDLKLTDEQEARINKANLKDSVNSGKIAVTWLEKARSLFVVT